MQNVKGVMFKKFLSIVAFVTCLFCVASVCMAEADVPPQIFIGDTPTPISIQRGMPVEVPIFFVGGTCADKEVELYVFRIEEEHIFTFGAEGWESDDVNPVCNLPGLPKYIYLRWQAFEDSQSLSNFDLWVCVDDQVDGTLTENSFYCGHQSIIIEEGDDDSGSGDDSGGFQPPTTAPPLELPGSDGACQSLEYTPEGTTFSSSSISESLELGASKEIILLTSACGDPVTVSSVNKTTGGEWLTARSGGGSKVILTLNAGATGLQAGSTYTGIVTVAAGEITDTMYVTLDVQGQCDPISASVTPTSLSFQAYIGGQNPSAQTLRVKDNCGDAVSATVVSKPNFVTLTQTGTGVFSVSCVASYLQEVGSYSGSITLKAGDYEQQHSVSVTLKVTETSSPPPDDSVTTVSSGHNGRYDVGAGQTRYFKFVAGVSDCQHPIQVGNASQSDQPHTVHLLIKRGSKPTIADFEQTWLMSPSDYDCGSSQWVPAKPGAENLYWKYNTGSQTEYVQIKEPMESNTFYIMLYNNGTKNVLDQRLTVSY